MLKGEDIRKLSDVDLEFYMLGVEQVERERNILRELQFTEVEENALITVLTDKLFTSKPNNSIEDNCLLSTLKRVLKKVRKM